MAEALVPLEQVNIPARVAKIAPLAAASMAMCGATSILVAGIPGIPKFSDLTMKALLKIVEKAIPPLMKLLTTFLVMVLLGALMKHIHLLNPIIRAINVIIRAIKAFLDALIIAITVLTIVIGIATIIHIISLVIDHAIPSFGFMAVATPVGAFASGTKEMSRAWLMDACPVASALIAVYLSLLFLLNLCSGALAFAADFSKNQDDDFNSELASASRSADDWEDINDAGTGTGAGIGVGDGTGAGIGVGDGVPKKLLEEALNMSEGDIAGAKDAQLNIRVGLSLQINNLENEINNLEAGDSGGLVECTLPDGSVEQLSPKECTARGGSYGAGIGDTVFPHPPHSGIASGDNLKKILAGLKAKLKDLGGEPTDAELAANGNMKNIFDKLGNKIITSLLHPNDDVTVKKATKRTGKRKGFYQQDL